MSPEAVDGELTLDGRTDIFAAGVVLYELLTGKRLFKGGDDLRTIALVRACKVEPPSSERPDIPPKLDRIVLKALARDRDPALPAGRRPGRGSEPGRARPAVGRHPDVAVPQAARHPAGQRARAEASGPAGSIPSEPSPATMQVTVLERNAGRSSASLPAVGRPRLRWAMLGAGGGAGGWPAPWRWPPAGGPTAPWPRRSRCRRLGSPPAADHPEHQPCPPSCPRPPSSRGDNVPAPETSPSARRPRRWRRRR